MLSQFLVSCQVQLLFDKSRSYEYVCEDNELKMNSEQSLYGYLREFANARECFNFVGTVADHVLSDESAACSRNSSENHLHFKLCHLISRELGKCAQTRKANTILDYDMCVQQWYRRPEISEFGRVTM